MNIAVVAAGGRSGRAFVAHALNHGHSIRAGIREGETLPEHANLTLVPCDATKEDDLRILFSGQEAVVSLIGHVKGSAPTVQTDAMIAIVNVMQEMRLSRLLSLTGTGVRFPGDKITLIDRFLNFSVGLIDPNRVADGRSHVAVITNTQLEWTIIRVLKLENISPQPFLLTPNGPTKAVVSREDVAKAILQVLTEHSHIREAPMLSTSRTQ